MQFRPGEHEAQLSPSQAAVDYLERVDPHLRASLRVPGMEMRRAVVVEEHRTSRLPTAAAASMPSVPTISRFFGISIEAAWGL
jgi:hypothetical protein